MYFPSNADMWGFINETAIYIVSGFFGYLSTIIFSQIRVKLGEKVVDRAWL